jgi:hypothetical protein
MVLLQPSRRRESATPGIGGGLWRPARYGRHGIGLKEGMAAETLATHPLQARPVRLEERIARKAAHVVEAPICALVLNQRAPVPRLILLAGSPHPAQYLRGLKPDPSQRGHSFTSCRKHSTNSGDSSCAERATLASIKSVLLLVRASGCSSTAGDTSFSNAIILLLFLTNTK